MMPIATLRMRSTSPVLALSTDPFDSDTSASYTVFQDGGSTWVWFGGFLRCDGGLQSVQTRNGVSFANGEVSCVITRANDAGLVLRLADNNNYYLLVIKDASSTAGSPNSLTLYKRVGGTFTQIGSPVSISFSRDTFHTVAFRISGATIQADFDGVNKINTSDPSLSAAGKVGVRANGAAGNNSFDSFSWPL